MTDRNLPPVLMIMLCMPSILGGAEKRYARLFEMLVAQNGRHHRLLINRTMLTLLQGAGILLTHHDCLLVVDPPSRRCQLPNFLQSFRPFTGMMRLLFKLMDALWFAGQCWLAIVRHQPQIVHPLITGMYLALPALLLRPRLAGVISAYSFRFEPEPERPWLGRQVAMLIKRVIMERAQAIDALSWSIRADLIAHGVEEAKIRVAPGSFTDFSLCQPAADKKKWVVFLARFVDVKQPLLLAQAVPLVLAQEPATHFYFLGNGPLQPDIEAIMAQADVGHKVTIQFDPQPTRILNQSAIFVSSQVEENYPSQSLLEAMACGNAIVATNVGETWRLVNDATGCLVPADAVAMAEAIIKLLRSPNLAWHQQLARQWVMTHHTPQRYVDYIVELYRTIS